MECQDPLPSNCPGHFDTQGHLVSLEVTINYGLTAILVSIAVCPCANTSTSLSQKNKNKKLSLLLMAHLLTVAYIQNYQRRNSFSTSYTFFIATQKSISLSLEHFLEVFLLSENYKILPV
jgi:hypothetical protein